jgi:hypothetical protein
LAQLIYNKENWRVQLLRLYRRRRRVLMMMLLLAVWIEMLDHAGRVTELFAAPRPLVAEHRVHFEPNFWLLC